MVHTVIQKAICTPTSNSIKQGSIWPWWHPMVSLFCMLMIILNMRVADSVFLNKGQTSPMASPLNRLIVLHTLSPLQHQGPVARAVFSPDGRRVVTSSNDGTGRVWDAATGEPITPPLQHPNQVRSAFFRSDGRQVVTTSVDKVTKKWDLSPEERPVEDLVLLAQVLASHRIDDTGALVPLETDRLRQAWETLRDRYPKGFMEPSR